MHLFGLTHFLRIEGGGSGTPPRLAMVELAAAGLAGDGEAIGDAAEVVVVVVTGALAPARPPRGPPATTERVGVAAEVAFIARALAASKTEP